MTCLLRRPETSATMISLIILSNIVSIVVKHSSVKAYGLELCCKSHHNNISTPQHFFVTTKNY